MQMSLLRPMDMDIDRHGHGSYLCVRYICFEIHSYETHTLDCCIKVSIRTVLTKPETYN